MQSWPFHNFFQVHKFLTAAKKIKARQRHGTHLTILYVWDASFNHSVQHLVHITRLHCSVACWVAPGLRQQTPCCFMQDTTLPLKVHSKKTMQLFSKSHSLNFLSPMTLKVSGSVQIVLPTTTGL